MTAVSVAVLAALPLVAAAAQDPSAAAPHRHEGGWGPGGPAFGHGGPAGPWFLHMAGELGLTDDQKTQLKTIADRQRESMKPLMQSARDAHEAFRQALESDSAEATAVGQAALAMKAAQGKLEAAHKAALEEFKSVLTPEQKEKLASLEKSREGRHGFEPGFGRPDRP